MTKVLITGGTGSLGSLLARRLVSEYEVRILSRDPHKQETLRRQVPGLEFRLGDVRNPEVVRAALEGIDIVIHAAALKLVDRGQTDAVEFADVNIRGTQTVAAMSYQARRVPINLMISTDKAVAPLNFYGKTKAVAEGVWLSYNTPSTCFAALRYGNVVGSNGSVWQIWRERAAAGLPLKVRDPEPTRFFLTRAEAVELVLAALAGMQGGRSGIYVPNDVPAFSLHDLAREFAPDEEWECSLLTAGEKQHEVLVAPGEHVEVTSNPLVSVIDYSKSGDFETPEQFRSETAPRISGREVIERLGKEQLL